MAGARFEARGARGAMVALVVVAVAVVGVLTLPGSASAKCTRWFMSGGELDRQTFQFSGCLTDAAIDVIAGPTVEPPDGDPGIAYEVGPTDWFRSERDIVRYYPEPGLVYGNPRLPERIDRGDRWMRPGDATKAMLDDALSSALALHSGDALDQGPIRAEFEGRQMADGSYTFGSHAFAGNVATHGRLPFFKVEGADDAREFAMVHLVETLAQNRADSTQAPPAAYAIRIWVPLDEPGGGWGGVIGYYTPPSDGDPGQFLPAPALPGSWVLGDPDRYAYETTPGFDTFVSSQAAAWDSDSSSGRIAASTDSPQNASARWQWWLAFSTLGVAGTVAFVAARRQHGDPGVGRS